MRKHIKASPTVAAFSGVLQYRLTSRGATVTLSDGSTHQIPKSKLPPPERISFFTLADALA